MLAQILRDMYIDPALLAELDDEQKSVLFCKMREEQIRRWKQREAENQNDIPISKSTSKKRVNFLMGADGKPWTWVVGEDDPKSQPSETHRASQSPLKSIGRSEEIVNNKNGLLNSIETTTLNKSTNGHVSINDGLVAPSRRPTTLPLGAAPHRSASSSPVEVTMNNHKMYNSSTLINDTVPVNNKLNSNMNNKSFNGLKTNGVSPKSNFSQQMSNSNCAPVKPQVQINGNPLHPANGCNQTNNKLNSLFNNNNIVNNNSIKSVDNGKPVVEVSPIKKNRAPTHPNKINFELRSSSDSDVALRNAENTFNSNAPNGMKNGHEVSQRGIEDELERLVRDVAEHSSPVQTDKQRWLREKQDIMRARDSSLPSSPVSPLQGSPPRHEIFRSSVPVPVCGSPSTNGLNGTSSNIPQLNSTQPNSHDWNSIDEQAWLEQGTRLHLSTIRSPPPVYEGVLPFNGYNAKLLRFYSSCLPCI